MSRSPTTDVGTAAAKHKIVQFCHEYIMMFQYNPNYFIHMQLSLGEVYYVCKICSHHGPRVWNMNYLLRSTAQTHCISSLPVMFVHSTDPHKMYILCKQTNKGANKQKNTQNTHTRIHISILLSIHPSILQVW